MVVSLTIDSAELPLVLFYIHNAFKLEFYIICSQINLQVLFYPVLKHSKATFLPWGVTWVQVKLCCIPALCCQHIPQQTWYLLVN